MAFSNNLQRLRKEANLSQEQLAERLHITRQAVSKWESGQSVPDADTCLALCEILAVSPNRLLLGEVDRNPVTDGSREASVKQSGDVVFSVFMMVTLVCGTVLLLCNLYNGYYFEPNVHTLSIFMICGSLTAFVCREVMRAFKKKSC